MAAAVNARHHASQHAKRHAQWQTRSASTLNNRKSTHIARFHTLMRKYRRANEKTRDLNVFFSGCYIVVTLRLFRGISAYFYFEGKDRI